MFVCLFFVSALFEHKKPVIGVFKNPVGFGQRAQTAKITDYPGEVEPFFVDLPVMLAIEHMLRLPQGRPGKKQEPGAEFRYMEAVGPNRSGIGQTDDHMPATDPDPVVSPFV